MSSAPSTQSEQPDPSNPSNPSAAAARGLGELPSDWFLRMLVKLADHVGISLRITLAVDGLHVTGEMISAGRYAAEFQEQFLSGIESLDETMQQSAADLLNRASFALDPKAIHDEARRQAGDAAVPLVEPDYIHLRSARVVHAPQAGPDLRGGALWRFRLTQVDGFSLVGGTAG